MKRKEHIKTIFLVYTVLLPLLVSACYSPPRNPPTLLSPSKGEGRGEGAVVVNAPFGVVREAVAQAMAEKNILIKTKETPTAVTVSGNLLVDVVQYADCGKYYGKRITGYADMNFVILVRGINKDTSGIQITSTVTITESDIMLSKERELPCISNGRMEGELLEAVMQKLHQPF